MKSRVSGRPLISFSLILALGVQLAALAQTSRPRYSGRQQGASSWVIPADTVIRVRMDRTLTSKTSRVGDRFTATVTRPLMIGNAEVIPVGSKVEGRITQVTPAKRAARPGTIAVDFDGLIFPDGRRVSFIGVLTSDDPDTRIDDEGRVAGERDGRPAVFVGGGGVLGAVLGGIAGGGKGAAIGGAIGAGIGVAGVLLTKGEEAQVPAGTIFGVQFRQDVRIDASDPRGTVAGGNDPYNDPRYDPRSDPAPSSRRPPVLSRPDPRPDPADTEPEDSDPADLDPAEPEPEPEDQNDTGHVDSDAEPEPEPPAAVETQLPLDSPQMIQRAQEALRDEGYYEGVIDGRMTPRVENSLKTYQRENNLPETGNLDEATADKLGIRKPQPVATRPPSRPPAGGQRDGVVLANILNATATRLSDGSIQININTQAPTGGWRWYGEHVVNGDTLEVFARAVRPQGMATQALTRGRIELNVREGVQYVRRVVIHGAGGDLNIALSGGSTLATRPPATANPPASRPPASASGMTLKQRADSLLDEYQRMIGVRMTGSGIEFEDRSRAGDAEIEVLFALDSFANAAHLYERMIGVRRGQTEQRGAVLALAREARKTDAVLTTTSSRAGQSLAARWDIIRQEILALMRAHNISAEEIDY